MGLEILAKVDAALTPATDPTEEVKALEQLGA